MNDTSNNQTPEYRITFGMLLASMLLGSLLSLAVSLVVSNLDIVDCTKPENFSDFIKEKYGTGQESIDFCNSQVEGVRSMGSWISLSLLLIPIITGIGYWRTNRKQNTKQGDGKA